MPKIECSCANCGTITTVELAPEEHKGPLQDIMEAFGMDMDPCYTFVTEEPVICHSCGRKVIAILTVHSGDENAEYRH